MGHLQRAQAQIALNRSHSSQPVGPAGSGPGHSDPNRSAFRAVCLATISSMGRRGPRLRSLNPMHQLIGWPHGIENQIHMGARIGQPDGRVFGCWIISLITLKLPSTKFAPERDRKIIAVVAQQKIVHKAVDALARFSRQARPGYRSLLARSSWAPRAGTCSPPPSPAGHRCSPSSLPTLRLDILIGQDLLALTSGFLRACEPRLKGERLPAPNTCDAAETCGRTVKLVTNPIGRVAICGTTFSP